MKSRSTFSLADRACSRSYFCSPVFCCVPMPGSRTRRCANVESRLAQARQRADQLAAGRRDSRPENVFSAEESSALRQAIGAIRIDWDMLYRSIDRAVSEDVSLLAVRPNAAGKSLQISGEARDMAAALAFVEALRQEPLAHIALLSHQIKQNDPQHPIIFEISATWLSGS